jgi:urease subunit alpha
MRPMFGAMGGARGATSLVFVSRRALVEGTVASLGLRKQIEAVARCRGIGKRDMKLNDALPKIEVDPESYEVRADGVHVTCAPASVLALAQRYSLF